MGKCSASTDRSTLQGSDCIGDPRAFFDGLATEQPSQIRTIESYLTAHGY